MTTMTPMLIRRSLPLVGAKLNFSTTAETLRRIASLTSVRLLMTRDTVASETPASSATSLMLISFLCLAMIPGDPLLIYFRKLIMIQNR